jgi:hypothetical protein
MVDKKSFIYISCGRSIWHTAQSTQDKREKIQALSLAEECYSMKLDLLTNATVVDDAIRFVSDRLKEKSHRAIAMKIINNQKNPTVMKMKISYKMRKLEKQELIMSPRDILWASP